MATVCSVASLLCPDMATLPGQMSANGCINYYSRESERERDSKFCHAHENIFDIHLICFIAVCGNQIQL